MKDWRTLPRTVSPLQIVKANKLLHTNSIRAVSRIVGISYFSTWKISKGYYYKKDLPKVASKRNMFDVSLHQDWIVGGRIFKNFPL